MNYPVNNCRVTKGYPQLLNIMKKGDRVEVIAELYKSDTEIHPGVKVWDKTFKKHVYRMEPVIARAGSYRSYKIRTKNGMVYTDEVIRGMIGYVPLDEFLVKCRKYKTKKKKS